MKKLIHLSITAVFIGGCAAIPAGPESARVIASPNPAPNDCKYIGQVVGNQGNFFTGEFTSNRNLEEGAMNDLKNKGAKIGANYIQIITNRAGVTGSMTGTFGHDDSHVSGRSQQTNVTNLGNAYLCPAESIGLE